MTCTVSGGALNSTHLPRIMYQQNGKPLKPVTSRNSKCAFTQ